ncbi:MAG: hypothetical protein MI976_12545 [Pseudomonadales bacterium]|nr:hypothetical protein [Pseudomonadales bacterium]
MTKQRYSAFAASQQLSEINDRFLSAMEAGNGQPQAPVFVELLHLFMDEVLDSYFVTPMDKVQLNGMGRKVVNTGVNAIRKTSKLAISKVVKKMSNDELQPIATYIDSIMIRPEIGSGDPTYVAVPISDDLYERLTNATTMGRDQGAHTVTEDFAAALCDLIDESLNQYFEVPVSMLKLGFVTEKVARVAMESGRAASQTVVKKVPNTMNEKELLSFFEFAESIVIERPLQAA